MQSLLLLTLLFTGLYLIPGEPFAAEVAADGAAVYRNFCAVCHGPYGEGVSGPVTGPAIIGNEYIIDSDMETLRRFISEGRAGGAKRHKELLLPMLPQELTGEEVDAVIEYIKVLAEP
jgi:mono/diheme cytochrome c family protein